VQLDEKDVRAMVRLIGEVAGIRGDHTAKKRFLMSGLCHLVEADCWVWGLSCQREPHKPQVYVSLVKDGFTEQAFVKFLEACEHPDMPRVTYNFFQELKEKKSHLTRSRHQVEDLEVILKSPADALWKAADIGPVILSMRPLDVTSSSMMGLYRRFGKPEFSPREVKIAHIVLSEVPWLHEQGWPQDRGVGVPKLSKRQRLALNLLTQGHGRKQIASHMNISVNTLHEYIKDIYDFFGVHSQAELMSRFYEGNGNDVR